MVPTPGRDYEDVPLRPLQRLAIDHGRSLTLEDVVPGRAVVPVGRRCAMACQHLDLPSHGREGRASIDWVLEHEVDALAGVLDLGFDHRGERSLRLSPRIPNRWPGIDRLPEDRPDASKGPKPEVLPLLDL